MFFNFTNPKYLYFLFLIPVLIFFHFYSISNSRGRALKFANFDAIARVKGIDLYSKNIIILILNILMVFTLVFSLSGLTLYKEMQSSSFSFVITIDSSESMGADDLKPTRLDAAKETSINFINFLPINSMAGVVSFSGNSFIEQELTNNKQSLQSAIKNIELTKFGGTDIYEAVSTSLSILKREENKAIILLSDGQINTGNIYDAVGYARENNVIIHTLAIGTKGGGNTSYGLSKIDEDSLQSLAYNTNGKFFSINNKEQMKQSFEEIVPLTEKIGAVNLSVYLIIITILIFILEQFLIDVLRISV